MKTRDKERIIRNHTKAGREEQIKITTREELGGKAEQRKGNTLMSMRRTPTIPQVSNLDRNLVGYFYPLRLLILITLPPVILANVENDASTPRPIRQPRIDAHTCLLPLPLLGSALIEDEEVEALGSILLIPNAHRSVMGLVPPTAPVLAP